MELQKFNTTCSMYELGRVYASDLNKNFKEDLKKLKNEVIGEYSKNKAILYNTNFSWLNDFSKRLILYKAGFRQISTYSGYCKDKVYVLIKKYK